MDIDINHGDVAQAPVQARVGNPDRHLHGQCVCLLSVLYMRLVKPIAHFGVWGFDIVCVVVEAH